jgi:hypothetical protein
MCAAASISASAVSRINEDLSFHFRRLSGGLEKAPRQRGEPPLNVSFSGYCGNRPTDRPDRIRRF